MFHGSQESVVSWDAGLRMDGLPALDLRDVVIKVLHSSKSTESPTQQAQENLLCKYSNMPQNTNHKWFGELRFHSAEHPHRGQAHTHVRIRRQDDRRRTNRTHRVGVTGNQFFVISATCPFAVLFDCHGPFPFSCELHFVLITVWLKANQSVCTHEMSLVRLVTGKDFIETILVVIISS